MINVLHIISDTNIGGAGIYVAEFTRLMDKSKFNIYVACPKDSKVKSLLDPSIKVIETNLSADKSVSFKGITELVGIIKQNNIHIVHTHASLSGRVAGKICGKKIVYTRHTPSSYINKSGPKYYLNKWINTLLSDKVIAVSGFVKNQLIEMGIPKNKLSLIYNGVDITKYQSNYDIESLKRQLGLKDEVILIHVGRLVEDKGQRYLLEAVSKLDVSYNIKLLMVGDGPKREELVKLANDLNIQDKVLFLGFINDLIPILAMSDIFVLPSIREAISIALIQAMCIGKPCIASNTGGIPEVVSSQNGILVEPKDVEGLKAAISTLYSNKDLRTVIGNRNKEKAIKNFDLKDSAKILEDIYIDLVSIN